MNTNEVGTTNLDAKLISNLGQAFEINELLKEDLFVLPQFNIATSSQSTTGRNKRISLYRFGSSASRKTSLSIVYRVSNLRESILNFLGNEASRAFRVVLGMRNDGKYEHKSVSDRIEQALNMDAGHLTLREDISDVIENKVQSLEHLRGDYLRRLIQYRRLGAQLRAVQADVLRISQFLVDPNAADRLRLESLVATQNLARQAVTAEDVVLSRNAYITKCTELSKSYLSTGLNCLQALKQKSADSQQLRAELLQESCVFIKDLVDNRIPLNPNVKLPIIKHHQQTQVAFVSDDNAVIDETVQQNKPFMTTGVVSGVTNAYSQQQQHTKRGYAIVESLEQEMKTWRMEHTIVGDNKDHGIGIIGKGKLKSLSDKNWEVRRSRSSSRQIATGAGREKSSSPSPSRTSLHSVTSSALNLSQSGMIMTVDGDVDKVKDETRDDILQDYANWVLAGQQQFESMVSQSMSRCVKMTLTALENKFMRASKSSSSSSSSHSQNIHGQGGHSAGNHVGSAKTTKPSTSNVIGNATTHSHTSSSSSSDQMDDDSAALGLVCDHWNPSKHLMWQIKQREDELRGAKKHFENVRSIVTNEVRDRLQAIYNCEIQQQMSTITRVQLRLKKSKETLRKHQMSMEAYQSLKI